MSRLPCGGTFLSVSDSGTFGDGLQGFKAPSPGFKGCAFNAWDKLRAKLVSFIRKLDRASAPEVLQRAAHESDCSRKLLHDDLSRDAKHVVAEPCEITIAPCVRGALPSMHGAIHFHDQPHR